MTRCHGNGADHCCYFRGEVCPFLEENTVPGRRWSCGLFREFGDWGMVHEDPRYELEVQPLVNACEFDYDFLCGDWPDGYEIRQCCYGDPDPAST